MKQMRLIILIFLSTSSFAFNGLQKDSIRKYRISITAGGMGYPGLPYFSQYEGYSHFTTVTHTPLKNSQKIIPGYFIGSELNFKPQTKRSFVLGINFSYHRTEYNYWKSGSGPGENTNTQVYNSYSTERKFEHFSLNTEIGIRRKLGKHFSIHHSVLVHQTIYSVLNETGSHYHSEWSYNSGTNNSYTYQFVPINNTVVSGYEFSGVSYRFGLRYNFDIKACKIEILAFRNFGFPARPWWGLGLNFFMP
jgi:hypothetical protein